MGNLSGGKHINKVLTMPIFFFFFEKRCFFPTVFLTTVVLKKEAGIFI